MEALSYCQLMERCIALEAEVAELRVQLHREQDYCLSVDMERMELLQDGKSSMDSLLKYLKAK